MEAEGAAGWDASAVAWIANVDKGDLSRQVLLDPVVLVLCGEVAGRSALDAGCGEGRFSRMLADRGALVSGFDPCSLFVETASSRHVGGNYFIASAEEIPLLSAGFDLVV